MEFKNNATLAKLFWASIAVVLFLSGLAFYVISSIFRITDFNELSYTVDRAQDQLSQARIAKEEFLGTAMADTVFLAQGRSQALDRFQHAIDTLKMIGNTVKMNHFVQHYHYENRVEAIFNELLEFEREFNLVVGLVKQKGFKNLGLEGRMRQAIHQIEQVPLDNARLRMLTLRRHEKDFLLRKDPDYVGRFSAEAALFRTELANTDQASFLLPQLDLYQSCFEKIVAIENQIGPNGQTGLRLQMSQTFKLMQDQLVAINQNIKASTREATTWVSYTLFVLFFIMVATTIWFLNWIFYYVVKPIGHIRQAVEQLAQGNLSVSVRNIDASRMLNSILRNIEQIIDKFRLTMHQAQQIVSRQIKEELPLNSPDDEVTSTLNQLMAELKRSDDEEAQRKWFSQGLAQLGETMRAYAGHADFYDHTIRELVKYLAANQGALFVAEQPEHGEPWLEMKACYAFDRKKHLQKRISKGEGLAGAAWAENEFIYLSRVPKDYSPIASGLGQASPNSVLIMPLKINEQTLGLVELASFHQLGEFQIDFVREAGQVVASYIQANQSTERTQSLLQRANQLAGQLQAQEEELRQNMEEMQATQEEMARNEGVLKAQIAELLAAQPPSTASINGHRQVEQPA
jgi:methyl-accepting chemotaxis protein